MALLLEDEEQEIIDIRANGSLSPFYLSYFSGMRMYMPSVMRVLMGEGNDVNKQRKNPNLYCYKLG